MRFNYIMKKATFLYSLSIFIFLVIFFVIIHPIAIFDTDDWYATYHLRLPIPTIGAWNPIKVFPEFLMTFFSYLGAYTLYPLTDRYCLSLSITNGLFVCFILTVYFVEFFLFIQKKYNFTFIKNILVSIIFIAFHFLIVLHIGSNNNEHLFYAYDMTCIYHYTLSTALNAALVMHLIRTGGFSKWKDYSKQHKFVLFTWSYLAIFSSLYTNIIFMVYVGVILLIDLINQCKTHTFKIQSYCKTNTIHLFLILTWFIALTIENTGGRSADKEDNILLSFKECVINLLSWFNKFNPLFIIFALVTIFLWIVALKNKNWDKYVKYFLAYFLTTFYILLLSSVVNSEYVTRIDVMFASHFWLLFILMQLFSDLITSYKYNEIFLGAIALTAALGTILATNSFKELNYCNIPFSQCEALADDIILQFQTADNNGETEIDLAVPEFESEINWPLNIHQKDNFSKTMYRHRITHNLISIRELIPSKEKTKAFINVQN